MLLLFALGFAFTVFAQEDTSELEELFDGPMDNDKLELIIKGITEEVDGQKGNWRFLIDSTLFICITDMNHNRMRIISPIIEANQVTSNEMRECMEANFHTALDSKYAISDGILWAVFIHPLGQLTFEQVISAISQVYSSANTFGTIYSSGELSFPKSAEDVKKDAKKLKKT